MLESKIYNKNNRAKIKKKGGSSYASKDYSNPFFAERRATAVKKDFDWKVRVLTTTTVSLVLFLTWFLLYSKTFEIQNIVIEGDGQIDKNEIQQIALDEINYKSFVFSPRSNIIFCSKGGLVDQIETKYLFDKLNISRSGLHTVKISYVEKKQALIWLEDGKYYNTDRSGYIISETNQDAANQSGLPIVENKSANKVNNKKIAPGGEYIDFMFALADKYKEYPDFKVQEFIIGDAVNMVNSKLVDGPEIYFSITTDIKKQLNKLAIIKNEKFKDDFKSRQYIDVSVGDSVYYK
ncbi:hypothetical protein L6270_03600 [Candidatus Parcubacteria bacterium]|nr:hypothetical protein [Patescibacteria group bacterium]MBU4309049.1 hypothetical protein [Patescibacteria group bacterium]MBU4431927.1 hypothetical protein [Patescibacteria group bacterium]MBU4577410.1 hypothetical protein [Patescibacteria group bacterium]MCG2697098.1 hypothetical protein [Candidatus Parcubacteria bacterium]